MVNERKLAEIETEHDPKTRNEPDSVSATTYSILSCLASNSQKPAPKRKIIGITRGPNERALNRGREPRTKANNHKQKKNRHSPTKAPRN
jgi:hypothetical protein